jgi:hypothetical protein
MIWRQDRQQLLRGAIPHMGGPILLRVDLPWRRRVTYAVVDGEAIDMRLARGHGRCLDLSRVIRLTALTAMWMAGIAHWILSHQYYLRKRE